MKTPYNDFKYYTYRFVLAFLWLAIDGRTLSDVLVGGFKYFLIFIPTWGNDPI